MTRNPVRWHESMKEIIETVYLMVYLNILFIPLPTLRYVGAWVKYLEKRSDYVYNGDKKWDKSDISRDDPGKKQLGCHAEYLKRVVAPSRLHFFNLKDSWAPLCKILNAPIPDARSRIGTTRLRFKRHRLDSSNKHFGGG